MDDEVQSIALAFCALEDFARGWDREPERLKDRFRHEARPQECAPSPHESCLLGVCGFSS
jgi:hypothetical protein